MRKFHSWLLLGSLALTSGFASAEPITLTPCPASPNCVSSLAEQAGQFVPPLYYEDAAASAWRRLRAAIEDMPRSHIVSATSNHLRVEFTSKLFRFVDDLEVVLDEKAGLVQIRSASRTGYSDFGVNRRRVENLRRRFAAPQPAVG